MICLSLQITHIFRDLLHGWGSILFCVNVSPAAADYDSTAGVLQYAAMATQIGNAARAEAPKRAIKAKSPNITKKRKVVAAQRPKLRCAPTSVSWSTAGNCQIVGGRRVLELIAEDNECGRD